MFQNLTDFSFLRRNPDFIRVWLSEVLILTGFRLGQIALITYMFSHPIGNLGVGIAGGLMLGSGFLPPLLFGKWIARRIDELSPKRLLLSVFFAASLVCLVMFGCVIWGQIGTLTIIVYSFLISLCVSTMEPALSRSAPDFVSSADRELAVSLVLSSPSIASLVGVMAGAMTVEFLGVREAFILNLLSCAIPVLLVLGVKKDAGKKRTPSAPSNRESSWDSSDRGLRFLRDFPYTKKVMIGVAVLNFFIGPMFLLLPALVRASSYIDRPHVLTFLDGALCVGVFVGNLLSGFFSVPKSPLMAGGLFRLYCGICFIGLSMTGLLTINMGILFIAGLSAGAGMVKFILYFHDNIRSELKGRFFSLLQAVNSIVCVVSYPLFGVLVDRVETKTLFFYQGVGVAVMSLYLLYIDRNQGQNRAESV